jgi:hypothetical protein
MQPSRCTALVLGAAFSLGLPAVLAAGEAGAPAVPDRVAAPKSLAEYGIASYRAVPQAQPEIQAWRLYDADSRQIGTLEHSPAQAEPAPVATAGEVYVLVFDGDTLVTRIAGERTVFQLNGGEAVAWVYDAKQHRVVAESPEGEAAFASMRPRVRLLNALVAVLLPGPKEEAGGGEPRTMEEAPCTGQEFSSNALGITRSRACQRVTAFLNNSCTAASTGACVGCCFLTECDCACVPETDFDCWCVREGRSCAPGCPPENPAPSGCSPSYCSSVSCYERARAAVPEGHRIIGGTCNFANDCRCDAWVNTCNTADGSRHTFYSGVQECPDPCPPGTPCGFGSCSGSHPQCCFDRGCAPQGADCCSDQGYCPSGWNCCDDGTGSCCPSGSRCCWLEDGPMCCSGGGDTLTDPGAPMEVTPRRPKDQSLAAPSVCKE